MWIGKGLAGLSLLLGLTPIHWFVQRWAVGVPDEYYPEYFWLGVALPIALVVLGVGQLWSTLVARRRRPLEP